MNRPMNRREFIVSLIPTKYRDEWENAVWIYGDGSMTSRLYGAQSGHGGLIGFGLYTPLQGLYWHNVKGPVDHEL